MPAGLGLTLAYGSLALLALVASLAVCWGRGWCSSNCHQPVVLNGMLLSTWLASLVVRGILPSSGRALPLTLVDVLCCGVVMLLWSCDDSPRRLWKVALANTYALHCVLYAVQAYWGGYATYDTRYSYDLSHNLVFLMQVALGLWPSIHVGVKSLNRSRRRWSGGVARSGAAPR